MQNLKDMYRAEKEEFNRKNHTDERTEFPVPKVKAGGRRLDAGEATEVQRQLSDWLVARANAIKANARDKSYRKIDNYLNLMTDARKLSLDPRILYPDLPRDENGKVTRCARNVKALYDKWNARKGTQLVFCDLSTPAKTSAKEAGKILSDAAKLVFDANKLSHFKRMEKAGIKKSRLWEMVLEEKDNVLDSPTADAALRDRIEEHFSKIEDADATMSTADSGFSVYDDLRTVLVESGIPENEIAFIHDYDTSDKKQALFDRVNRGDVRVLVGSSAKMGAGMNVQRLLVGLHHLDAPWRPSDVEQREGRIVRQGNAFYEGDPDGFEVDIVSYSTSGTADTVMWQILARKAAALEQFRNGDDIDSMEESSSDADQYAEFMATSTGDPVFRLKMEAERKYQDLDADVSGALMARQGARDFLDKYDKRVNEYTGEVKALSSVEMDAGELKKFSEALKVAEKEYLDALGPFEKEKETAKKALAEWENNPDTKSRGKRPQSPTAPKHPSILSEGVQKASEFARKAKKAIEPLTNRRPRAL